MAEEVTTEQLYHRLGTLETAIESQTSTINRLIDNYDRRFSTIETKIDRPFPWISMMSSIFAGLVVVGALFSFALQPLFTDTERNRQALIAMAEQVSERNVVIADFENLKQRVSDQRAWNQSLSDRLRDTNSRVVALDAQVNEYQREAEEDRQEESARLSDEVRRNNAIEQRISKNEANLDNLTHQVRTIDEKGSRKWVGRNE